MDRSRSIQIAAGAGVCAASGLMAWAVRGKSSGILGPSVWRGRSDHRAIALTFDDGPSESTPHLLDVLARYGVTATFFQCGANVRRLPHVARDVHDAGHTIGNHSYSHPLFSFRSQQFIETELRLTQEIIGEHTGAHPRWFRAPYGVRWFGLGPVQRRLRLIGAMWTVLGRDWKLGAGAVVERVRRRISSGAILCLHDGRELRTRPDISVTLDAVRHLVPVLLDQGYEFETIGRLICPTN
jgi:peptidoglycan/xylan/chitin deacetylase (PgdA/CDA1 family)